MEEGRKGIMGIRKETMEEGPKEIMGTNKENNGRGSCNKESSYHIISSERKMYPALMGSKTPTSKFSESKEVRWGSTAHKSPIGSTNNQWGMKKTPLIKVSLYRILNRGDSFHLKRFLFFKMTDTKSYILSNYIYGYH